MREIKFRGKRKDNGQWVFGGYHQWITRQICPIGDDNLEPEDIKDVIITDSFADWNMPKSMQAVEILPETLGQYTGLKDKNGKEIYEGDIIECVSWNEFFSNDGKPMEALRRKMKVVFYNGAFKMKETFSCGVPSHYWDIICNGDVEIIGNTYDNPELLEEVRE